MGKSDYMRTVLSLILGFSAILVTGSLRASDIVDIHSHIVTDEYLDCLRRHNAMMDDLYGSDYPFVPSSILQKVVNKVRSEINNDSELCGYSDDFFSSNALRLFGKETSPAKNGTERPVVKETMQPDGFVRLSKIEVDPQWLEEYVKYATEVGTVSLRTEPGVLTMYAVADKNNPCNVTILETYSSQEAYRRHIASPHFQKYKQGTLHMVKNLVLDDVTPLNPENQITNFITDN